MFPALVQVIENERSGRMAYFADGMVAQYDHVHNVWRPATAHIDYEALFCTTTSEPDLTLSPDIAVED
jgi:primosomal protein N''